MQFVRSLASLVAMAVFALTAAVLLWSNRFAGLPAIGGSLLIRAGRRAEHELGFDVVNRSDIPFAFDQLGHMALWFSGMMLFGWLGRQRSPLWLTATFVGAASLLSEAGQGWVSTGRNVEVTDAVANLVGVGLAFVALTAIFAVRHIAATVRS